MIATRFWGTTARHPNTTQGRPVHCISEEPPNQLGARIIIPSTATTLHDTLNSPICLVRQYIRFQGYSYYYCCYYFISVSSSSSATRTDHFSNAQTRILTPTNTALYRWAILSSLSSLLSPVQSGQLVILRTRFRPANSRTHMRANSQQNTGPFYQHNGRHDPPPGPLTRCLAEESGNRTE